MFTSVIIPILNEETEVVQALSCLIEQSGEFEIIVVTRTPFDNVSSPLPDKTRIIVNNAEARGALLNIGVAAAQGDVLLFLWPDTQLPPNAIQRIEQNFELLPQTIGGNFHLKFDDHSLFTRLFTRFLKRWRYRGRYYGNSGIFVRREAFEAMGGFRPYPILEDYDFARRLEKYGPTLYLPDKIFASARKFKHQKLKAAILWIITHTLFFFGVHPKKLARMCLEL